MHETLDRVELDGSTYEWLGQSTVRITFEDGFTIYTDPVLLDDEPPKADLILITHHHVDHCLPEYVEAIRKDDTRLAAFREGYIKHCARDIKGVRAVKVGQTVELAGVEITGVEAYTRRGFHSRGEGCGFVLETRGQRIYFSGDTGRTEEMAALERIDVAIVSICDNTYMIDPEEMFGAVKDINPRLFIPVHYTPVDEPDPEVQEGMFSTKDVRFFTRKENPWRYTHILEGTDIRLAVLKKLGHEIAAE